MATIQIVSLVDGSATPFDGEYVVEYDPSRDGKDSRGWPMNCHLTTTPDPALAKQFESNVAAYELWRSVDPRQPTRQDGKPNRPLTAFTVEIS